MENNPYSGFVGNVWKEYPQLAEWHNFDSKTLPTWKLEQFVEAGYHNFISERKPLYHLSKLIENFAQENHQPLLATFEKVARYKFVENRYQKLIKNIPRIWIVADFDKSFSAGKELPENAEFLSCQNTELANVWSVISRGPFGPFGLIAEEYQDGVFRGFFTLNQNVCREALNVMGKILNTKFTIQ